MEDTLRTVVAADGVELRYERSEGRGAPVVLLHGSLANRFAFRKIRPLLAESGRPLVLTVLRGHEGAPPVTPAGYGLATTEVADLLAVLDAEGLDRVDLVAHSTGGSIAVALAAQRPERVGRMVLIEPTLLPLLDGAVAERVAADTAAIAAAGARGDHLEALRGLLEFVAGSAWRASDAEARQRVVDALTPLAPLAGPHVAALAALAVSAADVAALAPPALLIYGKESAYFEAPIAARLAELRPDLAQLHLDGAGHNSHLERPAEVGAAAARFLF